MNFDQLREKAATLPMSPGVYIMRNKAQTVIYVGKAKKLKNRVSQYFQNTASHTAKTQMMVKNIFEFDVIIAASEFEALVLECSLIKRYQPKYNILLKDDKGYPYLRLDIRQKYPKITMVNRVTDDGAGYYGPFGSRGVTQNVLETIRTTLQLPACNKKFPQDIGKDRPCLNYHMNLCAGWCQPGRGEKAYGATIEQARQLLLGNYKTVTSSIREEMLQAADSLNFELAASLRDKLQAVESLGKRQLVTAGTLADTDVIGFAQTQTKACFSVLHFSGGNLLDKDYEILDHEEDPDAAISSLVKQYYLSRGFAPRVIMTPLPLEDGPVFEELLAQKYRKKTRFKVPQRGDNLRLIELAQKNALEEAQRVTTKEERHIGTLLLLSKMLGIAIPARIESFDISNISGTDMVASMVVFQDGKPKKSAYKRFKIEDISGQDDYAAMEQVLTRRFTHYAQADAGFAELPDLLLIDGGVAHAGVALRVLKIFDLTIPVFGMVKDEKHRTRALVTPAGDVIGIETQQSVFAFIGSIQEEVHRFAISYHRKLRSKRLQYSQLDEIPGIGPKRKQELLRKFKSIKGIKEATLLDLENCLGNAVAAAVYAYFHANEEGEV